MKETWPVESQIGDTLHPWLRLAFCNKDQHQFGLKWFEKSNIGKKKYMKSTFVGKDNVTTTKNIG